MPFIVGYHRVVDNFERNASRAIPPMLISAAMLERHLDWLGRRFEFVSLDEVGFHLESGRRFKRPAAAITFDLLTAVGLWVLGRRLRLRGRLRMLGRRGSLNPWPRARLRGSRPFRGR